MKPIEHFKIVNNLVEDILNRNIGDIYIFGASKAGWYVLKVLEFFNIKVSGFIDNNENITKYYGYNVIRPSQLLNNSEEPLIFIGAFRQSTADTIKTQLKNIGFRDIRYNMKSFLYFYFIEVIKRRCDKEIFSESIDYLFEAYNEKKDFYGYLKSGKFVSPFVTSNITQKCTLKCRDCGQLIPYYSKPKHFDKYKILEEIKKYCSAFDVVPEISFHGGEPFLHPEFDVIANLVSEIPNVVFINFITNGTIIPNEKKILNLSKSGADLHLSDYGKFSKHKDQVFNLCLKYDIYCDVHFVNPNQMWTRNAPIVKYNMSEKENELKYKNCIESKLCCQIMDGELFRCPVSMHATRQNKIPKKDFDYVNLIDSTKKGAELKAQIREYLTRTKPLKACDYCNPWENEFVEPAIQLRSRQVKND